MDKYNRYTETDMPKRGLPYWYVDASTGRPMSRIWLDDELGHDMFNLLSGNAFNTRRDCLRYIDGDQ